MTLFSKKTLCTLCLCAAAAPLIANAADSGSSNSGFHAGVGVGGGSLDVSGFGIPSYSLGGFAYTFFGGYRFNRWAAVEASYLDGGAVENTVILATDPVAPHNPTHAWYLKTEPHIATATAMGMIPLTEDFSLYARAGISHWWYHVDGAVLYLGEEGLVSSNETATKPIFGAGMSLQVDRALVRLEYDQTKATSTFFGTDYNFNLKTLTLSVAWFL